MIKKTVTRDDFIRAFTDYDREENFPKEGRIAVFNYLENLSEDTGEDMEMDFIALRCSYTEYENFEQLKDVYDMIVVMEKLEDNTIVITVNDNNGSFIVQNY